LVLGRLDLEMGDTEQGISHLQRSIALASLCDDFQHVCWSKIRLALVLSDRSGPESVAALLAELRADAVRAGDPAIIAAVHVCMAETEAKRGLLTNARRHVEVAKRWLEGTRNPWVSALAENVEFAIETMRSDFDSARVHATRCLESAEEAGAASIRASALGNLGNLSFLASSFEEAVARLTMARLASRPGSDNWFGASETLARMSLERGQLLECGELLDQIDACAQLSNRSSYANRHAQLTRMRWLARRHKFIEALCLTDIGLELAKQSGDCLLGDLILLARAELLQQTGKTTKSVALLRTLVPVIAHHGPEFSALYERAWAGAMIHSGETALARRYRTRALRVYSAFQHNSGKAELDRFWTDAIAKHSAEDESSRTGDLNPVPPLLDDVAAILLHAGRPELVAREIVDLLDLTACMTSATAVARAADGSVDILAHAGAPRTAAGPEERLAVGTARGREIEVLVRPLPGSLEAVATLNAVTLLLAALHELEQGRAEREERATLWPVDELPAAADGAVTLGHMRETMRLARRIANANVSVLITGESGTGKEVVARAVHTHSSRASKPFLPFNCAAVPRDMLESQLFGHRRGAFTGADRDNPGVIRTARDGTLFLDEIGEMSLDLQPKLLRFLESGEISPLGEPRPFVVNVRIIAATNAKLEALVKEGRFREDLFYRLNVIRLSLKPLRERRDEIPTLASHFLLRAADEFGKSHIRIAEETMERLALFAWPGNVRQLQNEIRRIVALAEPDSVLQPDVLAPDILATTWPAAAPCPPAGARQLAVPLGDKLNPALMHVEREMIKVALRDHHGRVEPTAKALGISRKGLYLKRQRLGL
jgi:DNA-binding NtrC family response regulator